METKTNGCVLAVRGIRDHLGCGATKANQIVASGVLPTFLVGRNRYARRADIETLTERFESADAQAAYARASYDNKRQERRAKIAAHASRNASRVEGS